MITRPFAIGCMRLSIEPDRDEGRAMAVLHAAFDAGVTLLDTAVTIATTTVTLAATSR